MACPCKNKSQEAQQAMKAQRAAESNRLKLRETQAKQQARANAVKK